MYMPSTCQIKLDCKTKKLIKDQSLTYDVAGNPTETYDSIIRRVINELVKKNENRIDVSKL